MVAVPRPQHLPTGRSLKHSLAILIGAAGLWTTEAIIATHLAGKPPLSPSDLWDLAKEGMVLGGATRFVQCALFAINANDYNKRCYATVGLASAVVLTGAIYFGDALTRRVLAPDLAANTAAIPNRAQVDAHHSAKLLAREALKIGASL